MIEQKIKNKFNVVNDLDKKEKNKYTNYTNIDSNEKFFKGLKREFDLVIWPSKKRILKESLVVIWFSTIIIAIIMGIDFVVSHIIRYFFNISGGRKNA